MRRQLVIAVLALLVTGCATTVSERFSSYPVAGQSRSRVVLDRAECEREAGPVPQFYAACMVSRGYISQVHLVIVDKLGSHEYRPLPQGTMSFYVRADRSVSAETVRADLLACERILSDAVVSTPTGTKIVRDLVAGWTFGAANITETRYRRAFNECMAPRGYGVSSDHDELK